MRYSFASVVVLSTLMMGSAIAEELDSADVPSACTTICKPIVDLTSTCDIDNDTDKTESDDAIEDNCICTNKSFDVASIAALCASCISQNGATTEDMDKIVSACSFATTSYAAAATSLVADITVSATKPTATGATTSSGSSSSSETSSSSSAAPTSGAVGRNVGILGYAAVAVLSLGFGWGLI